MMQRKDGFEYDLGMVAEMWNDGSFRVVVEDPQSMKNMGGVGWRLVSTFVQQISGKHEAKQPDALAWAIYERERDR